MNMRHESDRGRSLVLIATMERAAIATGDMLRGLVRLTEGTVLFAERMRANLGLTDDLIMAEAVMMGIAEAVGRQQVHEIVHEATLATGEGRSLFSVLSAGRSSWTAPLDALRLAPGDDAATATARQMRELIARLIQAGQWKDGDRTS
jgi:adenylosuccinate lyase